MERRRTATPRIGKRSDRAWLVYGRSIGSVERDVSWHVTSPRCPPWHWRLGQSYRAIAANLTAEGVPTKQGGRWHHSTVGKVVARREYYEAILGPF